MGKVLLIPNADFSANSIGSAIIAPTISVSPSGRVTITSDFSVYYTTNGSTPNTASSLYSGAFIVTDGTTIKAVAYSNGVYSSVVSETYTAEEGKYQPFENATWFNGYWSEGAKTTNANAATTEFMPIPSNGYYTIRPKTYAECGKYVTIRLYVADSATDDSATNMVRDEDTYGYSSGCKGELCNTGYVLELSSSAQVFSIYIGIRNTSSGSVQPVDIANVYDYVSMEYIGEIPWSIGYYAKSSSEGKWVYENYNSNSKLKNFYGTYAPFTPLLLSDYTTIKVAAGYAVRICLSNGGKENYNYKRTGLLTGTINISEAISSIRTNEDRFGLNLCVEGWSSHSSSNTLPFDITETPNYVTIT